MTSLTAVILPINSVSCISWETSDRTKISLALFKSELFLVPFFETETPTKTVTETMFQDAIYDALETNEYRGEVDSGELKFIYYNQYLIPISWTDLSWQPVGVS